MLLRFGVANHRSVRDYQELLLSASKRIRREGVLMPVPTLKEAAVPVAAIYGPNAAGKSNLIDAMHKMRQAITRSHTSLGPTQPIPRDPFRLDDAAGSKPTRFDCTFTIGSGGVHEPDQPGSETVYEYGFEYTAAEFRNEWLYRTVRKERQSTRMLFERETKDGQVHVDFGNNLRGENRVIANLTRPNSLFLSAAAQNNHPQIRDLYRYFAERWRVVLSNGVLSDVQAAERLSDFEQVERLLLLIKQADVGISEIKVEDDRPDEDEIEFVREFGKVVSRRIDRSGEPSDLGELLVGHARQRKRLRFIHPAAGGGASAFEYDMESKGTQTLISLLIPALAALSQGSLLVIDELDTSLHPDLARAFVSLFNREDSNPKGAQLVFSTHDVTLLGSGLIRQDEIWITDKGDDGSSRLTPSTDFKLRSRDDIEKAYRFGRLGGVPARDDFIIDIASDSVPHSSKP